MPHQAFYRVSQRAQQLARQQQRKNSVSYYYRSLSSHFNVSCVGVPSQGAVEILHWCRQSSGRTRPCQKQPRVRTNTTLNLVLQVKVFLLPLANLLQAALVEPAATI